VRVIAWLLAAHFGTAARQIYPSGSTAGSNKFVVNPASGGDSQRCAGARPTERRPATSNSTSDECSERPVYQVNPSVGQENWHGPFWVICGQSILPDVVALGE
jgi:hypothetical protein